MSTLTEDEITRRLAADQLGDEGVSALFRNTPLGSPDSFRMHHVARRITGATGSVLVFMGVLALLRRRASATTVEDLESFDDLMAALVTDPVETLVTLVGLLPSGAVLLVGLAAVVVNSWLMVGSFSPEAARTRLWGAGLYQEALDVLEPARRAVWSNGWLLALTTVAIAAAFGVAAWVLALTPVGLLPGWVVLAGLFGGHWWVSREAGRRLARRITTRVQEVNKVLADTRELLATLSDSPDTSVGRAAAGTLWLGPTGSTGSHLGLRDSPTRRMSPGPTRTIGSPMTGRATSLSEVDDVVFASRVLGEGVGIVPTDVHVVAPVTGLLVAVPKSGNAFGIRTDDGVEVMVHVGIDTARLKGEHFSLVAIKGERVIAGDLLAEVNLDGLRAAGYDTHDRGCRHKHEVPQLGNPPHSGLPPCRRRHYRRHPLTFRWRKEPQAPAHFPVDVARD